jgi:hypothetical protein
LAVDAAECRYAPKATPADRRPAPVAQGACGELAGEDEFRLAPEHLSRLAFLDGLAVVLVDDKAFYVARSGRTARVHVFENGADYFSKGLARTISKGKFGYIDRRLAVVIRPEYDFAFPFKKGKAIVCVGCAPVALGEHSTVSGGQWGVIDKTGAAVIPVRHSREEVEEMQRKTARGSAQRKP